MVQLRKFTNIRQFKSLAYIEYLREYISGIKVMIQNTPIKSIDWFLHEGNTGI